MSVEIFISLLSSAIILLLCVGAAIAVGVGTNIFLWDLIKDPISVTLEATSEDPEERVNIREQYHLATQSSFLEPLPVSYDPYEDGRRYFRPIPEERLDAHKAEVEELRKKFETKYPDFFSTLAATKDRQKMPRFFLKIISWSTAVVLILATPAVFYVATGYFGVNIPYKSYKQTEIEKQEQEEITKSLLGDLGKIADDLSNPRKLTIDEIEKITTELPVAISGIRKDLEKTNKRNEELRKNLETDQAELNSQKEKFDEISRMTREEFDAVKSVLFEETSKSNRQYYLIGLFSSIIVFWFSEFLKFWILRFWAKLRSRKPIRTQDK